jgi:hypothetical protein
VTRLQIEKWPDRKDGDGIGISFKDGWDFGIGFGLAMLIAVPLIMAVLSCVIWIGVMMFGGMVSGLL